MRHAAFALILMAGACRDDRPPAPTAEQSAQLNEMESALNDMSGNQAAAANSTR